MDYLFRIFLLIHVLTSVLGSEFFQRYLNDPRRKLIPIWTDLKPIENKIYSECIYDAGEKICSYGQTADVDQHILLHRRDNSTVKLNSELTNSKLDLMFENVNNFTNIQPSGYKSKLFDYHWPKPEKDITINNGRLVYLILESESVKEHLGKLFDCEVNRYCNEKFDEIRLAKWAHLNPSRRTSEYLIGIKYLNKHCVMGLESVLQPKSDNSLTLERTIFIQNNYINSEDTVKAIKDYHHKTTTMRGIDARGQTLFTLEGNLIAPRNVHINLEEMVFTVFMRDFIVFKNKPAYTFPNDNDAHEEKLEEVAKLFPGFDGLTRDGPFTNSSRGFLTNIFVFNSSGINIHGSSEVTGRTDQSEEVKRLAGESSIWRNLNFKSSAAYYKDGNNGGMLFNFEAKWLRARIYGNISRKHFLSEVNVTTKLIFPTDILPDITMNVQFASLGVNSLSIVFPAKRFALDLFIKRNGLEHTYSLMGSYKQTDVAEYLSARTSPVGDKLKVEFTLKRPYFSSLVRNTENGLFTIGKNLYESEELFDIFKGVVGDLSILPKCDSRHKQERSYDIKEEDKVIFRQIGKEILYFLNTTYELIFKVDEQNKTKEYDYAYIVNTFEMFNLYQSMCHDLEKFKLFDDGIDNLNKILNYLEQMRHPLVNLRARALFEALNRSKF